MKTLSRKFSLSAMLSMIFGASARQTAHEKLTRHIVALNQKNTREEIIKEVALCLKEILDYRLFALAIPHKNGIDVWLDPRMYRTSLESIIAEDFKGAAPKTIHYMNQEFQKNESKKT